VGTDVPATACPHPTAGYSRGPVPRRAEIPPGEGHHGAGPRAGPEPLATVSLGTLDAGGDSGEPLRSAHLGSPVQLLGHGGGGHGHGHRSCHLALLVPGLLFPLGRQMDEVRGRDGLDVVGGEEPRPAVDGPELPPCARQMVGMAPGWRHQG